MALTKKTYVDNVTIIDAQNLNDIQDAIIENEEALTNFGLDVESLFGIYKMTELTTAAMPTESVAASHLTTLQYNSCYYRLADAWERASEGAQGEDVMRYTYSCTGSNGVSYLKLDYFDGAANQITSE